MSSNKNDPVQMWGLNLIMGGNRIGKSVMMKFYDHTTHTDEGDGFYSIKCKKGLWSVHGGDKQRVSAEAYNYFRQYYFDGEYENYEPIDQ